MPGRRLCRRRRRPWAAAGPITVTLAAASTASTASTASNARRCVVCGSSSGSPAASARVFTACSACCSCAVFRTVKSSQLGSATVSAPPAPKPDLWQQHTLGAFRAWSASACSSRPGCAPPKAPKRCSVQMVVLAVRAIRVLHNPARAARPFATTGAWVAPAPPRPRHRSGLHNPDPAPAGARRAGAAEPRGPDFRRCRRRADVRGPAFRTARGAHPERHRARPGRCNRCYTCVAVGTPRHVAAKEDGKQGRRRTQAENAGGERRRRRLAEKAGKSGPVRAFGALGFACNGGFCRR